MQQCILKSGRSRSPENTVSSKASFFLVKTRMLLEPHFSFLRRSWVSLACAPCTASAASCPRHRSSEGFRDARIPCRETTERFRGGGTGDARVFPVQYYVYTVDLKQQSERTCIQEFVPSNNSFLYKYCHQLRCVIPFTLFKCVYPTACRKYIRSTLNVTRWAFNLIIG